MRIGIIGSGRIVGNAGRLFAKAGHEVMFSFSRDAGKLRAVAASAGANARAGTPREEVEFGEVLMLSVPWARVDEALDAAGPLNSKILIDTTNQFTAEGLLHPPSNMSATEFNARRAEGARLVKAYNTLTAGFQEAVAGRTGPNRVVMPYAGEDKDAKRVVAGLISDSGFEPFDVGGWADASYTEPPRRDSGLYGEGWRLDTARDLLEKLTGRRYRCGAPASCLVEPTKSHVGLLGPSRALVRVETPVRVGRKRLLTSQLPSLSKSFPLI